MKNTKRDRIFGHFLYCLMRWGNAVPARALPRTPCSTSCSASFPLRAGILPFRTLTRNRTLGSIELHLKRIVAPLPAANSALLAAVTHYGTVPLSNAGMSLFPTSPVPYSILTIHFNFDRHLLCRPLQDTTGFSIPYRLYQQKMHEGIGQDTTSAPVRPKRVPVILILKKEKEIKN